MSKTIKNMDKLREELSLIKRESESENITGVYIQDSIERALTLLGADSMSNGETKKFNVDCPYCGKNITVEPETEEEKMMVMKLSVKKYFPDAIFLLKGMERGYDCEEETIDSIKKTINAAVLVGRITREECNEYFNRLDKVKEKR